MRVSILCTLLVIFTVGLAFGQDSNFGSGPQYLMNYGSPSFARPISTPSLSLAGPPLELGASDATQGLIAGAENRVVPPSQPDAPGVANLFPVYYGAPPVSVIEISFPANGSEASSTELPESILDTGVLQITTPQALRDRGYGVTVAQAAAYTRASARHATRVYTNADVDRLHGRS
jgi:hypothetical protein